MPIYFPHLMVQAVSEIVRPVLYIKHFSICVFVIGPFLNIFILPFFIETMVEGLRFGRIAASRYRSGRNFLLLNWLTALSIESGVVPPWGFADGVVIGRPNRLTNSNATRLSGMRMPIVPVPAERMLRGETFFFRSLLPPPPGRGRLRGGKVGRTKVIGPGINFLKILSAASSNIANFFAAEKFSTIAWIGCPGRFLILISLFTAFAFVASTPKP